MLSASRPTPGRHTRWHSRTSYVESAAVRCQPVISGIYPMHPRPTSAARDACLVHIRRIFSRLFRLMKSSSRRKGTVAASYSDWLSRSKWCVI